MANNFNTPIYPVRVKVKQAAHFPERDALMYAIFPGEDGIPCGTCWMLESQSWLTCPLGLITPIIDIEIGKKSKLNENM